MAISVTKDCPDIDMIKKELITIKPVMIPNQSGFWTIRIYEYTHAEMSLFCIGYYPETDEWAIVEYTHGTDETKKHTLDEIIELLRTKYYKQEEE